MHAKNLVFITTLLFITIHSSAAERAFILNHTRSESNIPIPTAILKFKRSPLFKSSPALLKPSRHCLSNLHDFLVRRKPITRQIVQNEAFNSIREVHNASNIAPCSSFCDSMIPKRRGSPHNLHLLAVDDQEQKKSDHQQQEISGCITAVSNEKPNLQSKKTRRRIAIKTLLTLESQS